MGTNSGRMLEKTKACCHRSCNNKGTWLSGCQRCVEEKEFVMASEVVAFSMCSVWLTRNLSLGPIYLRLLSIRTYIENDMHNALLFLCVSLHRAGCQTWPRSSYSTCWMSATTRLKAAPWILKNGRFECTFEGLLERTPPAWSIKETRTHTHKHMHACIRLTA